MTLRVGVVFDITRGERVDGVITAHAAVFAGKPFGATLAEDDVSGNHKLVAGFLRAETFACAVFRAVVGAALGGMGGIADLDLGSRDCGAALALGLLLLKEENGGTRCEEERERRTAVIAGCSS